MNLIDYYQEKKIENYYFALASAPFDCFNC